MKVYVPMNINLVNELEDTDETVKQMIEFAGDNIGGLLSQMFEDLLSEQVLPNLNEGSQWARVLTFPDIMAETLVDDTEKILREASEA